MKKFILPLAVSLVSTAVVAGATYAIKRQGGIEPTIDKLKQNRLVSSAIDKLGDLKQRFAANDDLQSAAAA